MTHHPGITPDPDSPTDTNPVAAVVIHAGLTALFLTLAVQAGLPLAAGAALAWAGGACATVALLLAHDAAGRGGQGGADRRAAATAADL